MYPENICEALNTNTKARIKLNTFGLGLMRSKKRGTLRLIQGPFTYLLLSFLFFLLSEEFFWCNGLPIFLHFKMQVNA